MSEQMLEGLLKDFLSYSRLQENLSNAIRDCDEPLVMTIESEGRHLLDRLVPRLSLAVNSVADCQLSSNVTWKSIQSLVKCIEDSQTQISKNQTALKDWKEVVKNKLQKASFQEGNRLPQGSSENQNAPSFAGMISPSSTSPSGVSDSNHLIWVSPSESNRIGQKLDHLS